jgi:ethanolaminephosphotransferase
MMCRLAFATFGLLYALMATQLIIAHMCKEPLSPPWLVLALLAAGPAAGAARGYLVEHLGDAAASGWLPLLDAEHVAVWVVAAALGCYLVYVLSVIRQICGYLGIRVLSISVKVA